MYKNSTGPDLKPIKHLWAELEWRLRAKSSHSTSVSDLTNALLDECAENPQKHSKIMWRAGPEEWKLLQLQTNAMSLKSLLV